MYTQDFYITDPVGNNEFSYLERKHKQLFIPKLIEINSLNEIKLLKNTQEKVTFEDFDENKKLKTCYGLKNLYFTSWNKKPMYLVDNHNHVCYFWYLARKHGIVSDGVKLYHIDEHADMRDPGKYLSKPDSEDLQKVFEYTNFTLNVGNYIIPAGKEGLIGEVVQIRGEGALNEYLNTCNFDHQESLGGIILNLDLDFFQPELDYIDFDLKKKVILDIAKKAGLITICTSPFFIEQERALDVLKRIFTPSA